MARADKPEHRHPAARAATTPATLSSITRQSSARAHRARREQEKIGTGLSLRDLGGGEDVGRE